MSIYSDPNTSKKDFRIFVGTLAQIKGKETAGTVSFCQMLFATDTREFFLGNKAGKAIKYGSAAGVSDDDLKALFAEVANERLNALTTNIQAAVDAQLTRIPAAPSTAGTYALKVTVGSDGTATYKWVIG